MSKFDDCVALLRQHHQLALADKDETPEAEKLCDEQEALWYDLTEAEQARLTLLSADLNRIVMNKNNGGA